MHDTSHMLTIKLFRPCINNLFYNTMKLFIKNMVSIRCRLIVKAELENMGLHYISVDMGEVNLAETLMPEQVKLLKAALGRSGLELLDNKKSIIIEKIKNIIVEMIHYSDKLPVINFSAFISKKLSYDYTYLANLFSEVQGTSIAHFIIIHKIERVKELLTYNEMNLTEIAKIMQYSSVAHLANQFKQITGLTTSHFRKIQVNKRNCLHEL